MENSPITHEQIYQRLVELETKVDSIDRNTKELIDTFQAFKGAMRVIDMMASLAKPMMYITGFFGVVGVVWTNWKK